MGDLIKPAKKTLKTMNTMPATESRPYSRESV